MKHQSFIKMLFTKQLNLIQDVYFHIRDLVNKVFQYVLSTVQIIEVALI